MQMNTNTNMSFRILPTTTTRSQGEGKAIDKPLSYLVKEGNVRPPAEIVLSF